jgi:alkylation response protein AidB-like acyl-CoA dehydrogenase
MKESETIKPIIGGEFLLKESEPLNIFIPEDFSEEQKMMASACEDFLDKEVIPNIEKVDKGEPGLMEGLLKKAGDLGLLGLSISDQYGGMSMSFNTSMLIADIVGTTGSFSTAYGAHTGIATLPLKYYGTEEQKNKYLPGLVSGDIKGAYCLTEPDSGSDANSAKSRAKLSDDKNNYIINGQKMWISNAGFADLFIVFAKIDSDKYLSAFLVEKGNPGLSMNEEENKLGIKGSSTRQIFFNDCLVPINNLLGNREQGFKIALNVLNIGRIKLGAGVLGGCRAIITNAITYSNERIQFGVAISSFGAIKNKIAQMVIKTFACEAMSYRAGQEIENKVTEFENDGIAKNDSELKAIELFSVECAITKIYGSEILDYVVDEGVQIYGGMGFSEEAPMARAYRDARIARIYEGTNEINRMLLVGILLKRSLKKEIDLFSASKKVFEELYAKSKNEYIIDSNFSSFYNNIKKIKKAILMILGKAALIYGEKINSQQEILMNISDMIIELYAFESLVLRCNKMYLNNPDPILLEISKSSMYESTNKIYSSGFEGLCNFLEAEELDFMINALKDFTNYEYFNLKDSRRIVADHFIKKGNYKLFNIL